MRARFFVDVWRTRSMQVIEVGVPFTDPMADGTTIQRANEVALANGIVGPGICIDVVKEARKKGLVVPVVLMGYCNPFIMLVSPYILLRARALLLL